MASITDIQNSISDLMTTLVAIDTKLDEVKAKIDALVAGAVTQEQIDALSASVDGVKEEAAKVLTESTDLA